MIVVTGATGHIGNVLVRELLSSGQDVRAIVPTGEDATALDGLAVQVVEGDVRDMDSLTQAFEGSELVYHLAGIVAIVGGKRESLDEVNVQGTRNVVQACLITGVRRLIYTSSIHAIVEPPDGTVIDETLPVDPEGTMGDYARSKAQATLEVLNAVRQGLDAVIVCPSGVIGPYDYRPSEMGELFMNFALGRLKAYMDGAYDFVDVRDVVQGLMLASERGRSGETYILSGERISVPDLLSMLERITGARAPSLKVPVGLARTTAELARPYYRIAGRRPLFTPYSVYVLTSNSVTTYDKARRELGYAPRPIRQSIADAIQWFRDTGRL